jgi:hypothetical protein
VVDREVCNAWTGSAELPVQTESSGREFTLQALIDDLIDLDLAFERERDDLSKSGLNTVARYRRLKRLREQYRQRREPYVHQLIAQQQMSHESKSSGQSMTVWPT